jgi:ABC-type lipoprotein export system ATPase subunit
MVMVTHETQVAKLAPRTALINKGVITLRNNRRPEKVAAQVSTQSPPVAVE